MEAEDFELELTFQLQLFTGKALFESEVDLDIKFEIIEGKSWKCIQMPKSYYQWEIPRNGTN